MMTKSKAGKAYQCARYRRLGKTECSNGATIAKTIVRREAALFLTQHAQIILTEIKSQISLPKDDELSTLQEQLDGLLALPSNPAIDTAIASIKQQITNRSQQRKRLVLLADDDMSRLKAFSQAGFWEELSDSDFKVICLRFLEGVVWLDKRLSFSARSFSSLSCFSNSLP
jgi:hypothetical protein